MRAFQTVVMPSSKTVHFFYHRVFQIKNSEDILIKQPQKLHSGSQAQFTFTF